MDAIDLLREGHATVLAILEELERAPDNRRPVTPDDNDTRTRLMTTLVMEVSAHEAVEEEIFWPYLRRYLEEGALLAAQALEQEHDAKRLLGKLARLEAGVPEFEHLLTQVTLAVREHISYEERDVWPLVIERIAPCELEGLADKISTAKRAAPTRPHPDIPATPGALKTAGALAASIDKLRDAAAHRDTTAAPTPVRHLKATPSTSPDRRSSRAGAPRYRLAWAGLVLLIAVVRLCRRR